MCEILLVDINLPVNMLPVIALGVVVILSIVISIISAIVKHKRKPKVEDAKPQLTEVKIDYDFYQNAEVDAQTFYDDMQLVLTDDTKYKQTKEELAQAQADNDKRKIKKLSKIPMGTCEIIRDFDNLYRFRFVNMLKVTVAHSQGYSKQKFAENALQTIANVGTLQVVDTTANCNYFASNQTCIIEIYMDIDGKLRFRYKSSNGQIIMISQTFDSKVSCNTAIEEVQNLLAKIAKPVKSK